MTDSEVERIRELEVLVNEIDNSLVWKLATKELNSKKESLDSMWQSVPSDEILRYQVSKLAIMEISSLVEEWKAELSELKNKMNAQKNVGLQESDFDNE